MSGDGTWHLGLLACWRLEQSDRDVSVPFRQQRVIAAAALLGRRPRDLLAGLLWPEASEDHAAQSLRTCLWQIHHRLPGLLSPSRYQVCLDPTVATDLQRFRAYQVECSAGREPESVEPALAFVASARLLPGWYEDWVVIEQERIDRIRLHLLESLARNRFEAGGYDDAIEAAEAAAQIDPFRESSQRLLVRIHLATGNPATALRTYERFRIRLEREFGVQPTHEMRELLRP